MNVLHLAAGNRWTGAAAPAFEEVEALRAAGHEAHYAYVGGYRLETKIGHIPHAHAAIEKAQNPWTFRRSLRAIEAIITRHQIEIIHAHLTYDHWLAGFVAARVPVRLARTFHSRRVLRNDPFTKALTRRTEMLFVINDDFRDAPLFRGRDPVFTPPPVNHEQFSPRGADARATYGIPPDAKLVTVIGKVSPHRGFEEALHTFAALRRLVDCRLMIIGRGVHRPYLEELSRSLGTEPWVIWAGYHEEDLAEHYRASDLLLFTARGSDEGHRAILEALACGVPVASYPLEGVRALISDDAIACRLDPETLAGVASAMLARDRESLRQASHARSVEFGYAPAANRLLGEYGRVMRGVPSA
jgi:glycosyltransferase involved in cell wall biosynthesis